MKDILHNFIPDFPDYMVSVEGDLWSCRQKRYLRPAPDKKGYMRCVLCKDGKMNTRKMHRLMCLTFLPINGPEKFSINHKNFNKADNRIENLEWCLGKENTAHAIKGEKFYYSAGWNKIDFPEWVVNKLGKEPDYKIANDFGCSKHAIARLRKRQNIKSYAEQTGNNGKYK